MTNKTRLPHFPFVDFLQSTQTEAPAHNVAYASKLKQPTVLFGIWHTSNLQASKKACGGITLWHSSKTLDVQRKNSYQLKHGCRMNQHDYICYFLLAE